MMESSSMALLLASALTLGGVLGALLTPSSAPSAEASRKKNAALKRQLALFRYTCEGLMDDQEVDYAVRSHIRRTLTQIEKLKDE